MSPILVLDHDEGIVEAITNSLMEEWYTARGMQYGGIALSWLRQGYIPSLLIIDAELHDVEGMSFYQQLAQLDLVHRIPIILMANSHELDSAYQCLPLTGILMKPFSLTALLWSISAIDSTLIKVA